MWFWAHARFYVMYSRHNMMLATLWKQTTNVTSTHDTIPQNVRYCFSKNCHCFCHRHRRCRVVVNVVVVFIAASCCSCNCSFSCSGSFFFADSWPPTLPSQREARKPWALLIIFVCFYISVDGCWMDGWMDGFLSACNPTL